MKITCPTFFALTSYVWRDIPRYSTNICLLYGRHQTIAIDVVILLVFLKWVQEEQCISTFSKQRPKTRETDQANNRHRVQAGRYVGIMLNVASLDFLPSVSISFQNISSNLLFNHVMIFGVVSQCRLNSIYKSFTSSAIRHFRFG